MPAIARRSDAASRTSPATTSSRQRRVSLGPPSHTPNLTGRSLEWMEQATAHVAGGDGEKELGGHLAIYYPAS
jgi:hypothetical protein